MSLPDAENWNSLMVVEVMVFDNLTAKLLLGWFQSELKVGKGVFPQKLPAALSRSQASLI